MAVPYQNPRDSRNNTIVVKEMVQVLWPKSLRCVPQRGHSILVGYSTRQGRSILIATLRKLIPSKPDFGGRPQYRYMPVADDAKGRAFRRGQIVAWKRNGKP
jgi:hypothetical protein